MVIISSRISLLMRGDQMLHFIEVLSVDGDIEHKSDGALFCFGGVQSSPILKSPSLMPLMSTSQVAFAMATPVTAVTLTCAAAVAAASVLGLRLGGVAFSLGRCMPGSVNIARRRDVSTAAATAVVNAKRRVLRVKSNMAA